MSVDVVKQRLHRARLLLKKILDLQLRPQGLGSVKR